jgi:hypothetical protein
LTTFTVVAEAFPRKGETMSSIALSFIDGPCAGTIGVLPTNAGFLAVILGGGGKVFSNDADDDEPAGIAFYRREVRCGVEILALDRMDASPKAVAEAKRRWNNHLKHQALNHFYAEPDYSAYTLRPSDAHPQVPLQHGHRRASVDERLAPLILEFWKRNWDTFGSCQELRPEAREHAGMAYVDFPLTEQGQEFVAFLNRSGIHAIARPKTCIVACDRPKGSPKKHVLDSSTFTFPRRISTESSCFCKLASNSEPAPGSTEGLPVLSESLGPAPWRGLGVGGELLDLDHDGQPGGNAVETGPTDLSNIIVIAKDHGDIRISIEPSQP